MRRHAAWGKLMSELNVSQTLHASLTSIERTQHLLDTARRAATAPASAPVRHPAVVVDRQARDAARATGEASAPALDVEGANLVALRLRQELAGRAGGLAGPAEKAILELFRA